MQTDSELFESNPEEYGAEYRGHLLEQYKLFVATAERTSDRRASANKYLLSVNTLLVSLHGVAAEYAESLQWMLAMTAAGILVCFVWFALIVSYRNLNSAKFKVIHELEQHLPVALFDREWQYAQKSRKRLYKRLSHIERFVPLIFAILYIVLAMLSAM